jgi:hypothetical protein
MFALNPGPGRADAENVNDVAAIPDSRTFARSLAVITDAVAQLDGPLQPWERDELLDTIAMHAGFVRLAARDGV